MHAATHHDVDVVGVTISEEQATYARRRVRDAGLDERVEIRLQDYREIDDGPFDAISSIGMSEHVGAERIDTYFTQLHGLLRPGGRLLNHAISSVGGSRLRRRSFIYRYVFPDGELLDIADSLRSMERAGFEIRDVENLREHYAETLRCWVANLQANWEAAIALVGERRAQGVAAVHVRVRSTASTMPASNCTRRSACATPPTARARCRAHGAAGTDRPTPRPHGHRCGMMRR